MSVSRTQNQLKTLSLLKSSSWGLSWWPNPKGYPVKLLLTHIGIQREGLEEELEMCTRFLEELRQIEEELKALERPTKLSVTGVNGSAENEEEEGPYHAAEPDS